MGLKPRFVRLLDEDCASRRTVSDAIELLRQRAGFRRHDFANVHVGLLALPSGKIVGLIDIQFGDFGGEIVHCVSLPTSARFQAIGPHSTRCKTFDIARLVSATVNGAGQVTLADGTIVHAVEVLPTHPHYEPSDLDWCIVHHVVAIAEAQESCYRRWPDGEQFALSDKNLDRLRLDCSKLPGLSPPPLKLLAYKMAERDPDLMFSSQKLADSRQSGMLRYDLISIVTDTIL